MISDEVTSNAAIAMIDNRSSSSVQLMNIENRSVPGSGAAVGPGDTLQVNTRGPWVTTASDFRRASS